jgi:predicted TIM-barrel fold metal-dependent hydrolase
MNESLLYEDHIGLWKNELDDFLPGKLFDIHVHVGPQSIHKRISEQRKKFALTTFTSFTIDELDDWYLRLYPKREIVGSCIFGFPIREVDIKKANQYIIKQSNNKKNLYPLLLISPQSFNETIEQYYNAQEEGIIVYGIKPYFEFANKKGPFTVFDVKMEEFLSKEILSFADKEGLLLMLHTSSIGVADAAVCDFILKITNNYPNIKIVLAHMGRYCEKSQFVDFYNSDFLESYSKKNIYFDMSSVSEKEVFQLIFQKDFLHDKIMFGSDLPFGLITGVEIFSKTHGPIFLTRDMYPWTDIELSKTYKEETCKLTYNTYHCIHALKKGIETLNLPQNEKHQLICKVFYNNAQKLFTK